MRLRASFATLSIVLAALSRVLGPGSARAEICPIVTVGLDSTAANSSADVFMGESIIQTFTTPSTLRRIKSITVWRTLWQPINKAGMRLRIGSVTGSGDPFTFYWDNGCLYGAPLLLDGPTIVGGEGDSTHSGVYRFDFDPPFELPAPGKYFFALQANPCLGHSDLLAAGSNRYADGALWGSSRSDCNWIGSPVPTSGDLCFRMEFCATTTCAQADEGQIASLQVPEGYVIRSIDFASYGDPTGACGLFEHGSAEATNSQQVVEASCLGQPGCDVPASSALFGDPAPGSPKRLDIAATFHSFAPDLQVTRLTAPTESGDQLRLQYVVINRGHRAASLFATQVRLSPDSTIDSGDPDLWSRADPGLAAGDSVVVEATIQLPPEPRGRLYLGVVADAFGAVDEEVEVNDARAVPLDYASPRITAIEDVPHDQGGSVTLHWLASPDDAAGRPGAIQGYETDRWDPIERSWRKVSEVPASGSASYGAVVPTTVDSGSGPDFHSSFRVRALTGDPTRFFDSIAGSGYSVDNVPPVIPSGFGARYYATGVALHWTRNPESDVAGYRLYRLRGAREVASLANRVFAGADTTVFDPSGDVFGQYELTAVDSHGNEGPGVFTGFTGAPRLELLGTRPNPSPAGALTIEFMLDGWQPTRIELLDVAGRRVESREVGGLGPGLHAVSLHDRAAGGVYFARLIQGDRIVTKKVVLRP